MSLRLPIAIAGATIIGAGIVTWILVQPNRHLGPDRMWASRGLLQIPSIGDIGKSSSVVIRIGMSVAGKK